MTARYLFQMGSGVEAFAPYADNWRQVKPFLQRQADVIRQNVAIALLTKVGFLIAAPFGVAALWMAVLADTGATVVVTLNALRLLRATERLGPPHRS